MTLRTRILELRRVGTLTLHLDGDTLVRVVLASATESCVGDATGTRDESATARDIVDRLRAYDAGVDPRFEEIDLPAATSPFAARVRAALRATALGDTLTYAELAVRAGSPCAARAVGGALARNPWPIVVPCHRVLGAGGRLGGFTGGEGSASKRKLLAHEQAHWPRAR